MQKPVALVFATLLVLGAVAVVPAASAAPQVSTVSPSSDDTNGGADVTITGTGFGTGAGSVTFGGNPAEIISWTDTVIHAYSPPRNTTLTSPAPTGAVNIVVTDSGGAATTFGNGFTYTSSSAPTVTGSSPNFGTSNGGTSITVEGTNFASGHFAPRVYLGGTPAEVMTYTASSITVTSPAHVGGAVDIVVRNPDAKSASLSNAFSFVQAQLPTISTVAPSAGSSLGGTVVTITGTNFFSVPAVTFGGTAAVVCTGSAAPVAACTVAPTSSSLQVITPPHADGLVPVVVQNRDGGSVTKTNGFTYTQGTAPTLSAPASIVSGSIVGGSLVCLPGTGIQPDATVKLDGIAAYDVEVPADPDCTAPDNAISFRSPVHANLGTVGVVVTNPDGQSASRSNVFTYRNLLFLQSISPTSGSCNGGTSVTLTGFGFAAGSRVLFGSKEATGVSGSGGSLTAVTPSGTCTALGSVMVTVLSPNGQQTTLAGGYTYTGANAPTITGVSPVSGHTNGNYELTITGTNFFVPPASGTKPTVTVDTIPAIVGTVSATSIKITVPTKPEGASNPAVILVTNPGGQSASSSLFQYVTAADPTIAASVGSTNPVTTTGTNGGATYTLTGTGFATGSSVPTPTSVPANGNILPKVCVGGAGAACTGGVFATLVGTPTSPTATSLQFIIPAFATTGSRTVHVVNPNGDVSLTSPSLLNYNVDSPAPTIDAAAGDVSPTTGSSLGRTSVTIKGNGFSTVNKPTVTIGGAAATVTSVTATSLTVSTGARAAGANLDIVVVNADLDSVTATQKFTYTQGTQPVITALSVDGSAEAGGQPITITGTNFAKELDALDPVQFGGVDATNVVVVSDTQITATIPPHGEGMVTIVVKNKDGQSFSLANSFRYFPAPPTLTSLSDTSDSVNGGESTNFVGTGFEKAFAPFIGGQPVRDAAFGSSSLFTVETPFHAAGVVEASIVDDFGQTVALRNAITFVAALTPTVLDAFPASGPALGGTEVVIRGTGFAEHAQVNFGGIFATEVMVAPDGQSIEVVAPSHTAGLAALEIINPDGKKATLANGFNFLGSGGATPTSSSTSSSSTSSSSTSTSTTTTNTNTNTNTVTNTVTGTSTGTSTAPPVLTATAIKNANDRIEVTVTREGDVNIVSWDLPASTPATVLGVQVWRSNSPYSLLKTIPATDNAFDDGTFRDTTSGALASSKYLVTMYYGATSALGLFTSSNAPDTADYPGTASTDSSGGSGGSSLPTWAIVLIALGILFLVVLVAVLIARGRNREGSQGAAQGYAWQEEGEAKAAEGEWQPPAEVHQARCPACATSFTATGQKPIVTVCPGCGKKGILR